MASRHTHDECFAFHASSLSDVFQSSTRSLTSERPSCRHRSDDRPASSTERLVLCHYHVRKSPTGWSTLLFEILFIHIVRHGLAESFLTPNEKHQDVRPPYQSTSSILTACQLLGIYIRTHRGTSHTGTMSATETFLRCDCGASPGSTE